MQPKPAVEETVAALCEKVHSLESRHEHNEQSHKGFYDRLAILEKGHELADTLTDIKHKQLLESIERVGKQQSESITAMHLKIDAFVELTEIRHKEHERRLIDLEDAENRKILAAAQKREEAKKDSRKQIRNTTIAVTITAFLTLVANNIWDSIVALFVK